MIGTFHQHSGGQPAALPSSARRRIAWHGGLRAILAGVLLPATGARAEDATLILDAYTSGAFRWKDVAENLYSSAYQASYNYTQALVRITYGTTGTVLRGTLVAANLKPNFAYQLKLSGLPESDPAANEALGFSGRWWKEEWNGSAWVNGWNLNNKGTGYPPTPNDQEYLSNRDVADATSPTGFHYRFTGYRPFDYFITDENGSATLAFGIRDTYHVLFGSWQGTPAANDGPMKWHSFDPDPASHPAYANDYPQADRGVYGEWERLTKGKIPLAPGDYALDFLLTEESFHDSGLGGWWAHAAHGTARFTIVRPVITTAAEPPHGGTLDPAGAVALSCWSSTNIAIRPDAYWSVADVRIDGVSVGATGSWSFVDVAENRTITARFAPQLTAHDVPCWWLARQNPEWTNDFAAAAAADADDDGVPTWAEYQAGTAPADSHSFFRIESVSTAGAAARLVWLSPANDPALPPFRVARATNLVDWAPAGQAARSADGTNVWVDPAPPPPPVGVFYRITATNRFE